MTRRPCPACGVAVLGPKRNPINASYDPRGLTHVVTCTADQTRDTPVTTTDPMGLDSLSDMEQIKRNQWGQPLIVPPGGGKAVGYQRVTTFIKVMESSFGLEAWKLRQVACGLASRPDLRKGVDAHAPGYLDGDESDKKSLDDICKQALDAAASSGKATIGTALHRITERYDRDMMTINQAPPWAQDDLYAYFKATEHFDWLHIERMHVNDTLKVAGTPDRIALIDGQPTVVDLKTGSFWASSCATQLGIYANADLYDIKTATRLPTDYRKDRALVIHLPAGTGQVRLRWVDIAAGYREASEWAPRAHAWQKRRDLDLGDYTPPVAIDNVHYNYVDDLHAMIAAAPTSDALKALWATNRAVWTDAHTAAAKARTAALTAGVAA